MAKAKSKFIMVVMKSIVSTAKAVAIRPRNNDKLEILRWDPIIQQQCIYREEKKLKSCKR